MTRTVEVCPECDSSKVDIRSTKTRAKQMRRVTEGTYRCRDCDTGFDEPAERPAQSDAALAGLAGELEAMDKSEVGGS